MSTSSEVAGGLAAARVAGLFGPSGAGKTTLASLLPERWPERYAQVQTCATRPARPDDRSSYRYVDERTFARLAESGAFLAATEIPSATERRRYGYLREDILAAARGGRIVLAPVERHLAQQLAMELPRGNLILVGLRPPGATTDAQLAVLRTRLEERYPGHPERVADRLLNAAEEDLPILSGGGPFGLDAILESREVEQTANDLHCLLLARFPRA